jgi:hypothetical protein
VFGQKSARVKKLAHGKSAIYAPDHVRINRLPQIPARTVRSVVELKDKEAQREIADIVFPRGQKSPARLFTGLLIVKH